ncbi:unnamed protein product [Brassica oleracea var. botrytis]|uniref:(rape) hypothetical protein n=1 Tax=Brassica napus TaxID=3708 RepID=A0A078GIE6_BRANA|nr:unnamed protein product [Brassica napus]CDY24972.1 BnaC03g22000D [Brassica napus]
MVISKKTIVLSLALIAIMCIVMTTTEATHTGSGHKDKDHHHKSCASGTCKTGADDEPFNPGCEPGSGRRCRAG